MEKILKEGKTIFFGYGRLALEFGYGYLGLERGDEILYPDYICDVTVVAASKRGLKIKYYNVTDNLEPDFIDAAKLITNKTKAFLAVNYFGFPQPWEKIKEFCRQYNLFFIEDNAHSFLSQVQGQFLGSFGDIAILSFRKFIPLVNGAALIINSRLNNERFSLIQQKIKTLRPERATMKKVKRAIQRFCRKNNFNFGRLRKRSWPSPAPGATENEDLPFAIDKLTMLILSRYNLSREAVRARSNYKKDLSLANQDLTPIFPALGEGIVPLACPFYTTKRDKWLLYFRQKKIEAYTWPTLPRWVSENCESALRRWQRVIVFPVF